MRILKIIGKIFFYLIMDVVWLISGLVQKDKNLWVFGSWFGSKFADNSKYLFLYVKKHQPKIRPVWLTRSSELLKKLREKGYEAYKTYSINGFLYSIKAGCIIMSVGLDDVNRFTTLRSKKVQLWHGTPLKKIGYDDGIFFSPVNPYWHIFFPFTKEEYDMAVATSPLSRDRLSSALRLPLDNIVITGYPRNDVLLNSTTIPDALSDIKEQYHYRYLIFYLPTFRGQMGSEFDPFTNYGFDANKIEKSLEEINALLLIKSHPFNHIKDKGLLEKLHRSKRIKLISNSDFGGDIYPILRYTDILVTDYSSVYFDFLLLNRPIIFAPFDIERYVKRDREFYYNYNDVTPGPKAKDWDELLSYIKEAIYNPEKYESERKRICRMFNSYNDPNSSERVYKAIMEIIK